MTSCARNTNVSKTTELVHIYVNGEEIIATPKHPFYCPTKGWTDAVQLRAGDILVLLNGEYVVVEKIQHEILEAPVDVFNFQVEDYHTYYVASAGYLTHNTCNEDLRFDENQQAVLDLAKEYKNTTLTKQEAEILVGWAKEYGIKSHEPMTHPERSGYWAHIFHINIRGTHIRVFE